MNQFKLEISDDDLKNIKIRKESISIQIDHILRNFDFYRIHRMLSTERTMHQEAIPPVEELIHNAKCLLQDLASQDQVRNFRGHNGFKASWINDSNGSKILNLEFILAEYNIELPDEERMMREDAYQAEWESEQAAARAEWEQDQREREFREEQEEEERRRSRFNNEANWDELRDERS